MVGANWAWRRICMAMPGWTSRSARSERAAAASAVVHGDLADVGLGAAGVPGAVEVAGFDRRAVAGGEDQDVALPGSAGLGAGATLIVSPQPQRCRADAGEGGVGVGAFGLGLPAQ